MEATTELNAPVNQAEFDLTLSLLNLEPLRHELTLEAFWEIESIAAQLAKWAEGLSAEDLWVRALVMRMLEISKVGMSALSDGEETAADLAKRLRG